MKNKRIIVFFLFFFLPMIVMAAASFADLELSESERKWLDAHPTVKFTGDPNWLPYEAFDKKGNYIGIVAEHLSLISPISHLEF